MICGMWCCDPPHAHARAHTIPHTQQALEALVAPGSAHAGKFDAVLIETTGLADPGPIIGACYCVFCNFVLLGIAI